MNYQLPNKVHFVEQAGRRCMVGLLPPDWPDPLLPMRLFGDVVFEGESVPFVHDTETGHMALKPVTFVWEKST